jgi:hypothetical protein
LFTSHPFAVPSGTSCRDFGRANFELQLTKAPCRRSATWCSAGPPIVVTASMGAGPRPYCLATSSALASWPFLLF